MLSNIVIISSKTSPWRSAHERVDGSAGGMLEKTIHFKCLIFPATFLARWATRRLIREKRLLSVEI